MRIKAGLIGCGVMGRNHARALSRLSNLYELTGIYEPNAQNAEKITQLYGVPVWDSLESLIGACDALIIASPSPTHAHYGSLALSQRKDVLIEKPIALHVEEAKKLIRQASEQGSILMTGQIELFNPVMEEIKNILKHETILSLDCHRLSPFDPRVADTDVVKDLMIHDICNMQYLLGNDIVRLQSSGFKAYSSQIDYAQIIASYASGVQASLTASRITEGKKRALMINAKDAYISADLISRSIEISRKTKYRLDVGHRLDYVQENIVEKVLVQIKEPLFTELEHFAHCIHDRREPLSSGQTGLDALILCEQILASINDMPTP